MDETARRKTRQMTSQEAYELSHLARKYGDALARAPFTESVPPSGPASGPRKCGLHDEPLLEDARRASEYPLALD